MSFFVSTENKNVAVLHRAKRGGKKREIDQNNEQLKSSLALKIWSNEGSILGKLYL